MLLHVSGDKLTFDPFPFPHGRDAQATGSMVTYHRRYALVAALGMAAGDDDDGASAAARPAANQTPAPPKPEPLLIANMTKACAEAGIDPADLLAHAEIDKKLDEITLEDRPALLASLKTLSAVGVEGSDSEKKK